MAAVKLNRSAIVASKPRANTYDVYFSDCPRLMLRVHPSGVKTFYCNFARGKRVCIGRADLISTEEARAKAIVHRQEAQQGVDPRLAKRTPITASYGAYLDEHYAPWAMANQRTASARLKLAPKLFAFLLDTPMNAITALDVEKWRTARLMAGKKPSTVNRDLSFLKASLSKAVEWGLLDVHPLRSVK
jgi:hypothetical protein